MSDPVFFSPSRTISAGEIAALTGAELVASEHAAIEVTSVASATDSRAGALVFVDGKRNASSIASLTAAAILCTPDVADKVPDGIACLVTKQPQAAFAAIARLLHPKSARPGAMTRETGVSTNAHIDPTATIETGAIIEAGAIIGAHAAIGAGTVIGPHATIGESCQIGRDCRIGASATIQYALLGNGVIIHPGVRIGQDGFGYVSGPAGPEKMPQIGRVIIQDNVEVGANSTIDRGALADTIIGENTKIDNMVQIGHNVRIGRNCMLAAQCGISGSVTIGDNVLMGGGAGVADHHTVGDNAQLAARSAVMHNVPPGEVWGGVPATLLLRYMREIAVVRKLAHARGKKSDG